MLSRALKFSVSAPGQERAAWQASSISSTQLLCKFLCFQKPWAELLLLTCKPSPVTRGTGTSLLLRVARYKEVQNEMAENSTEHALCIVSLLGACCCPQQTWSLQFCELCGPAKKRPSQLRKARINLCSFCRPEIGVKQRTEKCSILCSTYPPRAAL